jgi:DNA polymerase-3 subunit epsilon/CBS domain-containing protein
MIVTRLLARVWRRPAGGRAHRVAPSAPLARLPLVAIDCETTGLDPRRDRIVSIAALPIHEGLSVADAPSLDMIVDPGVPIPPVAAAIHGIDAATVAGAPPFAQAYPSIVEALSSSVVVGHHVGFDLAILAHEAKRAGLPWVEPPHLDTAALVAGVAHVGGELDLSDLLRRFGIADTGGRHTASGDARMAADLFVELARRLIARGHGTFAGAVAAQRVSRR